MTLSVRWRQTNLMRGVEVLGAGIRSAVRSHFADAFCVKAGRCRLLDLMKGFCILAVISTHVPLVTKSVRHVWYFPFWVDMAVPVFLAISGYVAARSYERHGIVSLDEAYRLKRIVSGLIRFLLPFLILLPLELFWYLPQHPHLTIPTVVSTVLLGGFGKGRYYIPIMCQFVLLFPLVYFPVRRAALRGLVLALCVNLLFEVAHGPLKLSNQAFSFFIYRYWFLMAFGAYLATVRRQTQGVGFWTLLVAAGCAGGAFLWLTFYGGYRPVFMMNWTNTCVISVCWILPAVALLILHCEYGGGRLMFLRPLEIIGAASYEIYLVQKVFYGCAVSWLKAHFSSFGEMWLWALFICVAGGLLYYLLVNRLVRWIGSGQIRMILWYNVSQKKQAYGKSAIVTARVYEEGNVP